MTGTLRSLAISLRPRVRAEISWTRLSDAPFRGHQLHVVDDDECEAALGFQTPALGADVHQVRSGRIIDEELGVDQLAQRRAEAPPFFLIEKSAPETMAVYSRAAAEHAGE